MNKIDTSPPVRAGQPAVHSVQHFVFTVPELAVAHEFFTAFGLDVRRVGPGLKLYTFGHPHCWASIYPAEGPKKLQYISLGIHAQDIAGFVERIQAADIACEPHPLSDGTGLWLRDPDGVATQVLVGPKVAPSRKSQPDPVQSIPAGQGAAASLPATKAVYPRRLSHILRFTPDVPAMVRFCHEFLGLRLSDCSGDVIAFMHGAYGSDHHLVAFAKSHAPGLHHSSWDVGNLDDVGLGGHLMNAKGYGKGWGLGRHVLGSNYFYYVRDPWNSYAEYSYDIDFIPPELEWPASDHPPENSLFGWGPPPPSDFVTNYEIGETSAR